MITDFLDATADKFPEKPAFVSERRSMTFRELRDEGRFIAGALMRRGISRSPIAVFMEKEPECVAAFAGSWYSGNFYAALDVRTPPVRMEHMFSVLRPAVVITDEAHRHRVREFMEEDRILVYEDASIHSSVAGSLPPGSVTDTDPAYVLFTSGSTGMPKGAVISHRSLLDLAVWMADSFHVNEGTVIGNQTPFHFSMSVVDIYQAWLTGCTVRIIPPFLFSFPVRLLEYLATNGINFIYWVPTALLSGAAALGKTDMPPIDTVLFSGEAMPAKYLNLWRRHFPNATFANLYGPTEATDISHYYIIDRKIADTESIPIGVPRKGVGFIVMDGEGREAKRGGEGELCLRGASLALGYYNDPERTRAAFIQNPLHDHYPEVIYRTGDLVTENSYGELVCSGRKDFQIKHRGYRIEPGEIESAAVSMDGVGRCCCLYDQRGGRIALFYTGSAGEDELIRHLDTLIPEYMIPKRLIHLDEMPVNLNGKIDRAELKKYFMTGDE